MADYREPSRATLRRLTVWAPIAVLAVLAAALLIFHRPDPRARAIFVVASTLGAGAMFLFSRFVFAHVQRQEARLLHRTRELAEANEAMAVVKERQRIARELHDRVAQHVGYLHLLLGAAEQQMAAGDVEAVARELPQLKRVAREAYEEAREAIFGLRGMASRSLGLVPNLTEYLDDWRRQTGVPVDFEVTGSNSVGVPPGVEVQLIGIIQEAMANVRKHARAGRVLVRLDRNGQAARLSITDDGVGFDPALAGARRGRSFGMETMRERAETVGAKLLVSSAPGRGTRVEVEFPIEAPRPS